MKTLTDWHNYVLDFYGEGGIYDMGATLRQVAKATQIYIKSGADFEADSFDREKIRDIMIEKYGLVFPTNKETN